MSSILPSTEKPHLLGGEAIMIDSLEAVSNKHWVRLEWGTSTGQVLVILGEINGENMS